MFKLKNIINKLIIYKIYKTIKNNKKKEKSIIAFSGGVDSQTTLTATLKIIGKNVINIHINHKINKTDKSYENFCKNNSIKYNINFITSKIKLKKLSIKKFGLESFLRTKRYKKFIYIKKKNHFKNITLGTQKNEEIETKIIKFKQIFKKNFKFFKKNFKNLKKLKPFKNLKKIKLKNFLIENKIKWIEDKTNLKKIFLRNKIRIKLIPIINNLKI